MRYKEIYKEAAEIVEERYELICERIAEIKNEATVKEPFRAYFKNIAAFIELMESVLKKEQEGSLDNRTIEECKALNDAMYKDIMPENYATSYFNPVYAVSALGEEFGKELCFMAAELRSLIPYAFEGRKYHFTILCELFVEIYNLFEQDIVEKKEVEEAIKSFYHDYSEIFAEDAVRATVDHELDFFTSIIRNADLTDLSYLYRFGEYISENEIKVAEFLNAMSQEEIDAMASTYTEGYRIGFIVTGKDLSKKLSVNVRYPIGFERMVRSALKNFDDMGLKTTIYRDLFNSFQGKETRKTGCFSMSCNKQYDYDHKNDRAMYLDKAFVERRLECYHTAYENYKELANGHAGPAVIEVFGERPFEPINHEEALSYNDKQQQLNVYYANEMGQMVNEYIKGEERSFTIIAYPIPEIGDKFKEIFAKTVEINTLDYKKYQTMQQKIIDVLDTADRVHIKGKGANRTDLYVNIVELTAPEKQTAFENCVADVNIPVGEVFTSPVLTKTEGILNVSQVYLNELKYIDLEMRFEDGKIAEYSCKNFGTEEENKKYIHENVLFHHDTLPMGEFAIGTNTTAYRMARDFDIADKLPILIAEKTGPHFAVGDTCYSNAEDTAVYNPDGKEIIARDNEISLLRKEDMSKAYFNCHTDITIPYDELDTITVIRKDGSTEDIIRDGRFVVEGCEELNIPLDI